MAAQTSEAICVRAPASPLMRERVIEPYAGSVPGTNAPARFAAPRATSSRFGLIEYEYRAAFCFAATMLSRNPTIEINLNKNLLATYRAGRKDIRQTLRWTWFVLGMEGGDGGKEM